MILNSNDALNLCEPIASEVVARHADRVDR